MKKTLVKDTLRSIASNKLRFISVVLIVAMGLSFFIGIKSAAPQMHGKANEYFAESNLMDVRVASGIAFSDEDINKIKALEGVSEVISSRYVDAVVSSDGNPIVDYEGMELSCRIRPLDILQAESYNLSGSAGESYVNRLRLQEGRFPEKSGECVIDAAAAEKYGEIRPGVQITFAGGSLTQSLAAESYTVVGTVTSPMYISSERGNTDVGSGMLGAFVYVADSDFITEDINELFIKIENSDSYDKFSNEYNRAVTGLASEIRQMSKQIIDSKLSVLKADYAQKIAAKEQELKLYNESSAKQLAEKKKEIEKFKAYVDSEDEILAQLTAKSESEKSSAKKSLDSYTKSFGELNASYEANVKSLDKQSSEIKGYKEMQKLYNDLDAKHKKDKQALDSLEGTKNSAFDALNVKTSAVTSAENEVKKIQNRIDLLKSEVSSLTSEITSLENSKSAKEKEIASLETKISGYEAEIQELELKQQSGTLTNAESIRLSGLKISLSAAKGDRNSTASELNKIQSNLDAKKNRKIQAQSEQGGEASKLPGANASLTAANSELAVAQTNYSNAKSNYDSAKSNYDEDAKTLEKYLNSLEQLTSGQSSVSRLSETVAKQKQQLESMKISLTQAQIKYTLAVRKGGGDVQKAQYALNVAKSQYDDKDGEYTKLAEDVERKTQSLNGEIKKLKKTLKNIDSIAWSTTPQTALPGHNNYATTVDNYRSMSSIFPYIFLLTSMVACFVIMMKNVSDERSTIGLLKAFGYSDVTIFGKSALYGGLSWLGGALLGTGLGTLLFPWAIQKIHASVFSVPLSSAVFNPKYVLYGLAASLLTTFAAVFFAVIKELRFRPAELLRPKDINYNRHSLFEKFPQIWSRMSYGTVLVIRTVIRSRKRVLAGVLSIGCCSALILSAFGLLNSASDVYNSQYGEDDIFKFDVRMVLNTEQEADDSDVLKAVKADKRTVAASLISNNTVSAYSDRETVFVANSVSIIVPSNSEDVSDFVNIRPVAGSAALGEEGAVISEKLAKNLKISVGDDIHFKKTDDITRSVKVTGIVENYINHYAYMSEPAYAKAFGDRPEYRYILCTLKDYMGEQETAGYIADYIKSEEVSVASSSYALANASNNSVEQVGSLVALFVIASCLLALIVMYTVSNVNISERTREIANIKVLGFSNYEVLLYVCREILVSSALGCVIGLAGGIFLHKVLLGFIEVDTMLYGSTISWWSYLVTVLIVALVAAASCLPIMVKINKVDMAETMKTVD